MFARRKILTFFFKLTVYEKHQKDIPNILIFHLIRGFDDTDVNKISTVCFRHLFTLIIYSLHDCQGGMKINMYSPQGKSYFPMQPALTINATKTFFFCILTVKLQLIDCQSKVTIPRSRCKCITCCISNNHYHLLILQAFNKRQYCTSI